jgi:hypothetical protein
VATLDLTPRIVDLKLYLEDDPLISLPFWTDATKKVPFDLTGYTTWVATVKAPDGTTVPLTVDATQQAASIITVAVNGAALVALPVKGCRWDFRGSDPLGREITFVQGRVSLQAGTSA